MSQSNSVLYRNGRDARKELGHPSQTSQVKLVSQDIRFPVRAVDLRLTYVPPGGQVSKHREVHEHAVYILDGHGYSVIGENRVDWQKGDAFFVPSWTWHQYWNLDPDKPAHLLVATNYPSIKESGLDRTEWAKE